MPEPKKRAPAKPRKRSVPKPKAEPTHPVVEVASVSKPAPTETTLDWFVIGDWNGHENFKCSRCSFASLDRRTVIRHYTEKHTG